MMVAEYSGVVKMGTNDEFYGIEKYINVIAFKLK
jgi:hypothetical protein